MCADVRPLLPDWAADGLAPAARRAVESHLRSCAACRTEADGWRALAQAANAYVSAAGPPPAWRSPLAGDGAVPAVRAFPAASAVPVAPPAVRQRKRAVLALASLAAAVAIVAFGGNVVRRATSPDGDAAVGLLPNRSMPTIVARMPTRVARLAAGAQRSTSAGRTNDATGRPAPADRAGTSFAAPRSVSRRPSANPSFAVPTAAEPTVAGPASAPPDGSATASTPSTGPTQASPVPPTSPSSPSPPSPAPPASPSSPPPPLASPIPPTPPTPPPGSAIVTGIVTGPDGFERAEVNIIALPFDTSEASRAASTGATGAFTLTLPAGRWSIHAESPAYLPAWPDGALTPLDGAPLDVAAGAAAHLRFTLSAASWGAIRGRVVDTAGVPVDGALVLAAAPDTERGGYRAFVAATFADADGRYALAVDEGAWLVAAATDWRAPYLTWWGGDGDLVAVDWVAVSRERAADGIDIRLREPGAD